MQLWLAELTLHSEKLKYIWLFIRFFVTLEEISNHLCLSEVWEITQFYEVTIWKPSDFRILPRYAYCKTTRR